MSGRTAKKYLAPYSIIVMRRITPRSSMLALA